MKRLFRNIWIAIFLFNTILLVAQENDEKLVYVLNIKKEITKATWRQTDQAFFNADSLDADVFLIHMNTYGGTVADADLIRTRILESKIPVYVFIDNNAASAGALISIACDSIWRREQASYSPVHLTPTGLRIRRSGAVSFSSIC